MPARVVRPATADHLLRCQAEEEEVFFAGLLCHLNRRAVACADRKCAVHHELHVACATGFVPCGGNLVGDLAGWNEVLRKRDAVLGQEYYLQPSAYYGVAINRASQIVNELDNQFGEAICRGSLSSEEKCARIHIQSRVLSQPVVKRYDSQSVQELTFVLMDTFYLAIKDSVRIKHLPCRPPEPIAEFPLGIAVGLQEVVTEGAVFGKRPELAQLA